MTKLLSEDAVRKYQVDGIHFPVRVMSEGQAADLFARFEALEAREGGSFLRAPIRSRT